MILQTYDELKIHIKDIPISQVLSAYVSLKNAGRNKVALCPFHEDRHPSLMVSDEKNLFRCFACETGGDAIAFVMSFKSLGFLDALEDIAQKMGLQYDISTLQGGKEEGQKALKKKRYGERILLWAIDLFESWGRRAREADTPFKKFIGERGPSEDVIKVFRLGYAQGYGDFSLAEKLKQVPQAQSMAKEFTLDI